MTIKKTFGGVRHPAAVLVRLLASLKLTILFEVILAASLGWAIFLETSEGREYAQWYVYRSAWFPWLLGALAANIAAATLVRSPWRWNRPWLVIVPVGLLVLLAGFIQTLIQGIEGRLILRQGETARKVMLPHRSQLTLLSPRGKDVQSTELCFSPGPADWRSDQPLDFGEVDGVGVKVLRFFRHARYQVEWVADEAGLGKPAIQVAISDSQRPGTPKRWCVPMLFGSPTVAGGPNLSIEQASVQSLRESFLEPPSLKPGSQGILAIHYKDRVYHFPVDGNLGKKLPVGDSGLAVEIVEYYANAMSNKGKFSSVGAEPKNPMLRLQVHAPDRKQPISEIAYANRPFVNYEAIKKQPCPVKFWYHHPAAAAALGAEFVQTPDGRLYCRVGTGKACQPRGEVKEGDRITVSADLQISLLRFVPRARQQWIFVPVEPAPGEPTEADAAALVELTTAEKSEQFWLGRNDARLGVRRLKTPGGPLIVTFGYERFPLGFAVRLVEFQRAPAPDSTSNASCTSRVYLIEGTQESDVIRADNPPRDVSTDRPLQYGSFTFHQSGVWQLPGDVGLSDLRVTSDPGWLLTYSGGAMICGGLLFMLLLPVFVRRPMRGIAE